MMTPSLADHCTSVFTPCVVICDHDAWRSAISDVCPAMSAQLAMKGAQIVENDVPLSAPASDIQWPTLPLHAPSSMQCFVTIEPNEWDTMSTFDLPLYAKRK